MNFAEQIRLERGRQQKVYIARQFFSHFSELCCICSTVGRRRGNKEAQKRACAQSSTHAILWSALHSKKVSSCIIWLILTCSPDTWSRFQPLMHAVPLILCLWYHFTELFIFVFLELILFILYISIVIANFVALWAHIPLINRTKLSFHVKGQQNLGQS